MIGNLSSLIDHPDLYFKTAGHNRREVELLGQRSPLKPVRDDILDGVTAVVAVYLDPQSLQVGTRIVEADFGGNGNIATALHQHDCLRRYGQPLHLGRMPRGLRAIGRTSAEYAVTTTTGQDQ